LALFGTRDGVRLLEVLEGVLQLAACVVGLGRASR